MLVEGKAQKLAIKNWDQYFPNPIFNQYESFTDSIAQKKKSVECKTIAV